MDQRFIDRFVSILQLDVFSGHRDGDLVLGMDHPLHKALPAFKRRRWRVTEADLVDHEAVDLVAAQVERAFIDRVVDIAECDNILALDITEHRDLAAIFLIKIGLGAANDDVWLNADLAQLGDRLLRRLGLRLTRRLDVRQQRDMDETDIFLTNLERVLPECFEEKQSLHVAHGAADFSDEHIDIRIFFRDFVNARLDLIGHMRNELHGLAQILAAPLFADYRVEDLTRGKVVHPRQHAGGEALVVTKVEVGLRTIVEHIDLAVLVRRHGAWIDIEIGIEFLHQHLEPAVFEQRADGCCGKSFAE